MADERAIEAAARELARLAWPYAPIEDQQNWSDANWESYVEKARAALAAADRVAGEADAANLLMLLRLSTCFGKDVCQSLPCACAETLAAAKRVALCLTKDDVVEFMEELLHRGFMIVPMKPTDAMLEELARIGDGPMISGEEVWGYMLAATRAEGVPDAHEN